LAGDRERSEPAVAADANRRRTRLDVRSRIGNWAFSLVAMIVIPLFPLFVEAMKNQGKIKGENYLLTSAVLAATFGFTSEGSLFRAAYILLFLASLGYISTLIRRQVAHPVTVHTVRLPPGFLLTRP